MPIEEDVEVTYKSLIGPMLKTRCGSCHGEAGLQGLDLTSYQTTLQGGVSGPGVIPGDPDGSLIVHKQSGEQPHFAQLNAQELELLIKWINAGAPEQ